MEEIWKDIKGYEGLYKISSYGRVKSLKNNIILKPQSDGAGKGYYYVHLKKGANNKIHKLVAEAFIPKKEGKREVNHKDGNTKNNSVSNLEWVTHKENCLHREYVLGQHCGEYEMKSVVMINIKDNKIKYIFSSISKAIEWIKNNTKYKNPFVSNISKVCRGKRRCAYGYKWQYLNKEEVVV